MPRAAFKTAQNPRLDLAYLIETPSGGAARLAAELGCRTATFDHALADPNLVGVIIASASDTHLDFAIACLKAGKAVFCEKPLDLELSRLRANAADFAGPTAPLYVAFNRSAR